MRHVFVHMGIALDRGLHRGARPRVRRTPSATRADDPSWAVRAAGLPSFATGGEGGDTGRKIRRRRDHNRIRPTSWASGCTKRSQKDNWPEEFRSTLRCRGDEEVRSLWNTRGDHILLRNDGIHRALGNGARGCGLKRRPHLGRKTLSFNTFKAASSTSSRWP